MTTAARDRMIDRVARSLCWADRSTNDRDAYRYRARFVVDDLLNASAEGKAVERSLRLIEKAS